ncbi:MAG: hypothetical protein JRJ38_04655 [Deltaproteobacteria bacterium]|nr:hypothetical protein [Deltaproteobacteria bacterium]
MGCIRLGFSESIRGLYSFLWPIFIVLGISLFIRPPLSFGDERTDLKALREEASTGRKWILEDWEDNSRPYPKNLREREQWYRKKWGEDWYGPVNKCRIHNPGHWEWEVVDTLPPDMAAKVKEKQLWGDRWFIWTFVWAPEGEHITDLYVVSDTYFYHFDPVRKSRTFIGSPEEAGLVDGVAHMARLHTGDVMSETLDHVTGRIYFIQKKENVWRAVEKLFPYECTKSHRICYLPAVLDWDGLYRKVKSPFGGGLKLVTERGVRADPVFLVRSNPSFNKLYLPGPNRGKRLLVSADGTGVFLSKVPASGRYWSMQTLYETMAFFDLKRGKPLRDVKLRTNPPKNFIHDGPGTHGGNNVGYDGKIYTAQHGGCCGPCGSGPGRMFSIDPETGELTMLYDSIWGDKKWVKTRNNPVVDGPADARSLRFTSTRWQTQCPRTGAIVNGGWDASGIRRYHDGFVTSIVNGAQDFGIPPRPGWTKGKTPKFVHRNCNPSIAPDGSLYIADVHHSKPRVFRIYRTDWPAEQPVNGYADKCFPKDRLEALRLEYAREYIENYEENSKILKKESVFRAQ